jgi:hypothetical protein
MENAVTDWELSARTIARSWPSVRTDSTANRAHTIRGPNEGSEEDVSGSLFEQSLCPSSFLY